MSLLDNGYQHEGPDYLKTPLKYHFNLIYIDATLKTKNRQMAPLTLPETTVACCGISMQIPEDPSQRPNLISLTLYL